jgi:pimeloyl-ACP methyl ester carboxylesterase
MTDIVLVHGAFHGGWCWREVADALTSHGHRVLRPTLTGLADRRHLLSPDVVLDTHIDDIIETIHFEELHEVVLVLHSYGGMPGIGAADRIADEVAALVLLDAVLPLDGYSSNGMRDRSGAAWSMEPLDPLAVAPPSSTVFGIAPADVAHIDALLTAHPSGTLEQPIALTGAYDRIATKHYHRALGYAAPYMDDSADRAEVAGWRVQRHDLVHDMMLTDPDWTVRAVLEACD